MNGISSPICLQWEVTYQCNMKCIHCYNFWNNECRQHSDDGLNEEIAAKVVDDIIKNKIMRVVITGGEPLVVLTKLLPYINQLYNANVDLSLNSNLSLLTHESAEKLVTNGVRRILASFNASDDLIFSKITKTYNGFSQACVGFRIAEEHGISVTPNMVITKLNADNIFETAKLLNSYGIHRLSINRAIPPTNCKDFSRFFVSRDEFLLLMDEVRRVKNELGMTISSSEAFPECFLPSYSEMKELGFSRSCLAGKTFCVVNPMGTFRRCIAIDEDYGTDLSDAWIQMKSYNTLAHLPNECTRCERKSICQGGCEAFRRSSSGIQALDPYAQPNYSRTNKSEFLGAGSTITRDQRFVFSNDIRFRDEHFGGLLYLLGGKFELVDHRGYGFFKCSRHGFFGLDEVEKRCECSKEEAQKYIYRLLQKGFIFHTSTD